MYICDKKLNKGLKVDYLQNDFAACVASAGIISNKTLHYAYVCDCGVCIFDKNGKLKFKTKNEGPNPKIGREITKHPKKYGLSWKDPRCRARTRSHYRNNPKESLSYGALTGEKTALKFIRTGVKKLNSKDIIIFYSDGFIPIIFSKKFNITKHFPSLEEFFSKNSEKIGGSEGTLVTVQIE